jgi:hypothetical protein
VRTSDSGEINGLDMWLVQRYQLSGQLDSSFGGSGTMKISFGALGGEFQAPHALQVHLDGRISAARATFNADAIGFTAALRLTQGGRSDPSLDGSGRRVVDLEGSSHYPLGVDVSQEAR